MRIIIAAAAFSLVSAAALAQLQPSGAGASNGQPQSPAVVSNPGGSTPATPTAASNAMPLQKITPPPAPDAAATPTPSAAVTPVSSAADPDLLLRGGLSKSDSTLIKDAPLPGDFVMGKASAPIIMIEYASLSCPHCAHFNSTTLPELEKKYIDTGKMRYILRQFPLNEPALKGAMLLDCVGEQDKAKYYVFAKVLFDSQDKWAFDANYMTGLETIAGVGGVSKEQFQHCTNDTDREMKVLKVKKAANDELKVPHTPYIFIDGLVYEGDRTIENMSKFIDARLALVKK
jgi:protein-disulfide isomerase